VLANFFKTHWAYLLGAIVLHLLFAGIFGLTMLSITRRSPPPALAIQAVMVDPNVIARASRRQEQQRLEAEKRVRKEAEARARQEADAERKKQEQEVLQREEEQRVERERQLEQKKREDEAVRLKEAEERQVREREEAERERAAEAEREKARKAEAEKQRVAEIERRQKEEAERRRAAQEARAQESRESELKRQLEEEEGRNQAASAGLLNQYLAILNQHIVRNWNRPPSARAGIECEIRVAQAPGGTVLSVQLGRCNGDAAVRQSIEAAVMRASPLPPPPDARVFERNLLLIFKPED
jgi:colicin import membrane protein